jgi:DNA-nicking Smr family endonuclease
MKKRKDSPPKPKEFANPAFYALKGVQAKAAEPTPVKPEEQTVRKDNGADDMDLFLLAMSGVERLGVEQDKSSKDKAALPVKTVVRKIEESEQQAFLEAISGLKLDVKFHDESPDEPVQTKPASGSRMKQLRRGTIRIDYELDLHGLSEDEALDALGSFVKGAYRREQKAVLVITGRGNHSPAEPVLKGAVDKWLRANGKEMVVEFLAAPREMGGDGALVIFLRPLKETP